jgi:hypothetical protein
MSPWTGEHIKWLVDTGERLKTADGKDIAVWEFRHQPNVGVLSAWGKHFRNHYCMDADIDFMRGKRSRKDYLNEIKFPSKTTKLGPAIRAGDFGEILVADYLHWVLDFWVPRVRWGSKVVRDESPKGSDVIGFKFFKKSGTSSKDVLAIFESKAKFSKGSESRLQDAINDSAKDHIRIDESLNYIKQKLFEHKEFEQSKLIERFQSPVDLPYQESYGAAAIITEEHFETDEITRADTRKIPKSRKSKEVVPHPNRDHLVLLLIKGTDMMTLVHELYRRAADEA